MAKRPDLPRLMGQQEIRDRLGYTRGHTWVIIGRKGFPEPVYTLAMGRIWLAEDVEKWIAENRPALAEDPEA